MSDRDQRIEELHQKASASYLQGDTAGALAAWRELLATRPDDERALEGVRLCEMLAEPSGPSFAVPPATDRDRPANVAGATSAEVPDQNRRGLDPGNLDSTPTLGLAQSPSPPPAADTPAAEARAADVFDFDFSDPETESSSTELEPVPPPAAVAEGATLPGEAAAAELANRATELVAEATTAYEQGRRDDALGLIGRVYILDEENAAARSLEEIIKAEVAAEQEAATPEPQEDPGPSETVGAPKSDVLDLDLSSVDETGAYEPASPVAATDALVAEATDEPADLPDDLAAPLEGLDDGLDLEGEALPEPLPIPVKKKATVPGWALIAAAVILVGAGAYLAMGMLADDSVSALPAEELMPTPAPEIPADVLPAEPEQPTVVHTPEEMEQLDALLAEAQTAFDSDNYAAAVIALGEVIEIDPGNQEARHQLEVAGERYREQKDRDRKWQEAIQSFNEGGYRNALTIFYRLPAETEEDKTRLVGYRTNAWYNMGVNALRSSDCRGALSHFKEAQALDPDDEGVLAAIDMAHRCGTGDHGYYQDLEAMRERGLED